MARFFLSKKSIHDQRGTIAGEELYHLRRVLRLGSGDRITLFDDTGLEHEAIIRSLGSERADLEILRTYQPQRESSLAVTLAVGLTKGEKMDLVVEKATELGAQTIAPFCSNYTVPQFDKKKFAKRAERWRKIALSATKQSGRTRVPAIHPLCELQELIGQPWAGTLKLLFWEGETQQTLRQVRASAGAVGSVLVVVGPEGGFSDGEAEAARQHGFWPVRLGPRTLRAETAALAALSLVEFLWGDLA